MNLGFIDKISSRFGGHALSRSDGDKGAVAVREKTLTPASEFDAHNEHIPSASSIANCLRAFCCVLLAASLVLTLTGCGKKDPVVSDKRSGQVKVQMSRSDCTDANDGSNASIDSDESMWDPNNYKSREDYIEGTKDALVSICQAVGYKYPSTVYATMFYEGGMVWENDKFKETTALARHTMFGICCTASEDPKNWTYWDDGSDDSIKAGNGYKLRLYKSYKNAVYDYFAWMFRNDGSSATWNGVKYESYMHAMNAGKDAKQAIAYRNGQGYCRETEAKANSYAEAAMDSVPEVGKKLDSIAKVTGEPKNIEDLSGEGNPAGSKNSAVKKKSGSKTELVGSDIHEQCWNYFKSQGLSDVAAAAVMGNIQGESGFDPKSESRIDLGLFQFTHWQNSSPHKGCDCMFCDFKDWAGTDKHSVEKQLTYVFEGKHAKQEHWKKNWIINDERYSACGLKSYTADEFENADDIERATYTWMACWERPAVEYAKSSYDDNRLPFAKECLEKYGGTAATNGSETAEKCEDEDGDQVYGNAGTEDGEKYHQGQGHHYDGGKMTEEGYDQTVANASCAAYAWAVAINILLGEVHKYCGFETFEDFGKSTSGFNIDNWKTKGGEWLKKKGLDKKIELDTTLDFSSAAKMAEHLNNGYVLVVSCGRGASSLFYDSKENSKPHPQGHYIMFYKYQNGTFYANDSCGYEDIYAGCIYTTEHMDAWLKGCTGGSRFGLKRK